MFWHSGVQYTVLANVFEISNVFHSLFTEKEGAIFSIAMATLQMCAVHYVALALRAHSAITVSCTTLMYIPCKCTLLNVFGFGGCSYHCCSTYVTCLVLVLVCGRIPKNQKKNTSEKKIVLGAVVGIT